MAVKVKESFDKIDTSKITTNLKNTFYVDREIQDIMKKYYQIKRNLKKHNITNFLEDYNRYGAENFNVH